MRYTIQRFAVITIALTTLCSCRSIRADRQRAVLELEQSWLAAENDPAALGSILADDFVHVLPFGFVRKAEQIEFLRSHPGARSERETRRFGDLRVRVYGDTAIANGIVLATGTDGKVRKTIFTDVFVYRRGAWQAVNAQELVMADAASH
jgi:ketosteroid isomerase-like protein